MGSALRYGDWRIVRHSSTMLYELAFLPKMFGERNNLARQYNENAQELEALTMSAHSDSAGWWYLLEQNGLQNKEYFSIIVNIYFDDKNNEI